MTADEITASKNNAMTQIRSQRNNMLKETKFKEADVVVMRIIGGEEIIARFIAQTEEKITVRKPLALVPTQTGLGMTNYIMMADVDDTVDFNLNAIVVITKASKAASDNYTKSTSGIVPASAVPKLKV